MVDLLTVTTQDFQESNPTSDVKLSDMGHPTLDRFGGWLDGGGEGYGEEG